MRLGFGKRVLVVDDNEVNLRMLRQQLQTWKIQADCAASGKEALEILDAAKESGRTYAIAILDYQMPEMDGMELATRIRTIEQFTNLPLILLTSVVQRGDAERAKKIGFDAYLTKPIHQSHLLDAIQEILLNKSTDNRHALVTMETLAERRAQNRYRILVAEDNLTNQKVVAKILEKRGYRVDVVANGKEAVRALELAPYDLILIDCQMPVLDGYAATRKIRESEKDGRPRTPIVALTAHAMAGEREKCLAAGMDDYLSKPVRAEELSELLSKLLLGCEPRARSSSRWAAVKEQKKGCIAQVEARLPVLRQDLGDDGAHEVLDMFIKDGESQIEQLKGALSEGNVESVAALAHMLKSSSGYVGCATMQAMCQRLEREALSEGLADASGMFRAIKTEFDGLAMAWTNGKLTI